MTNLLKWVSCDYVPGEQARLHIYPEVVCWTGSHSLYAAFALMALMAYLMASNWVGVFFLENPDPNVEVKVKKQSI